MRRKGIYIISILVLACLVISAFFAPGLVMEIRDRQLFQDYVFQSREGIDYEAINTHYLDRAERLESFAQGKAQDRQYYIAASGIKVGNWEEILQSIFTQDLFWRLWDIGLFHQLEELYSESCISDWDYYVIFDDDASNGTVFMCLYLELETDTEKVRVLADASDYTVYYLEIYHPQISEFWNYQITDWIWYEGPFYLQNYYSASTEKSEEYIKEQYGVEIVDGKTVNGEQKAMLKQALEDENEITCMLEYGENSLQVQISFLDRISWKKEGETCYGYGISMGISELIELLPRERLGQKLESFG